MKGTPSLHPVFPAQVVVVLVEPFVVGGIVRYVLAVRRLDGRLGDRPGGHRLMPCPLDRVKLVRGRRGVGLKHQETGSASQWAMFIRAG